MKTIHDDELEILSVLKASKLTGLSRDTIAKAMNVWSLSRGRMGLRFIQPNERRLIRRSELLKWFEKQELQSSYV